MTQREKVEMLKGTIVFLYEKEGRSKSYIAKLLNVNRGTLTSVMNNEWKLTQAQVRYLNPSNLKFLNKHRNLIKSRLDSDFSVQDIATELGVSDTYLHRTIFPQDKLIQSSLLDCRRRGLERTQKNLQLQKESSSYNYGVNDLECEIWKGILGHEGYFISNMGRVKKYIKTYDDYILLKTYPHPYNNRLYAKFDYKTCQISRLVGFSFVEGFSEKNNTINHIDRDVCNNRWDNLEWVSQSKNNKHAFDTGRAPAIAYSKNGNFKKIILDGKYEFKTIRALSKFMGKSESQTGRYIDGKTPSQHTFEFIY